MLIFLFSDLSKQEEPRVLGLAMVPGRHIMSMHIDMDGPTQAEIDNISKLPDVTRPCKDST